MSSFRSKVLLSAIAGAVSVAAHGHVNTLVIDGVEYDGYDVTKLPYESNPPVVIGWATSATDNGFVAPDAYASADIICHKSAENAGGHAQVAAGGSISFVWDTWPESHHGPVIDYMAACGDSCETVDKSSLEWFKIDEVGLIDGSSPPGTWASDTLISNGNTWLVTVPESIAPGFYVLRHEIIALHSANNADGAQNYPQCINIEVTGSGSDQPSGVLGTELYKSDDAGILVNIYQTLSTYDIPGPTMYSGGVIATQSSVAATATSSATTGSALATGGASSTAAAGTTSTTAAAASSTTAAASGTATDAAETSDAATTTAAATTTPAAVASSTTAAASSTTSGGSKCSKRKHRRHAREVV